jgi:MFS family permease
MTTPYLRRRVKNSLRLATYDGAAFSAMAGLTQNFITPFALALKATTAQIGLLASIPNLMMAISQLAAPDLTERVGSRKGLILPVVFIHALMWVPILLVPYLFPDPKIWWLIVFVIISAVFGSVANPAWGSMMADLVPMKIRGRYFSFRARTVGLVALAFSFAAGGILEMFSDNLFLGFAVIFGAAAAFRLLSFHFLSKMYEPEYTCVNENEQSIISITKNLGSTNLGRFTLYVALITFATSIAGPFFAVYMLRDLNFSYITFVFLTSANALANLAFQTFWGRRADKYGNIRIVKITSRLMPLIPIIWLFNSHPVYLAGAQIYSGIVWSGFTLASTNFVYDASDSRNRAKHIAIFNAVSGVAGCLGALAGGFLARYVPVIFNYNLQTMFLISGIMRGVVVLFLLRLILEVRVVPTTKTLEVLFGRNGHPVPVRNTVKKEEVITGEK